LIGCDGGLYKQNSKEQEQSGTFENLNKSLGLSQVSNTTQVDEVVKETIQKVEDIPLKADNVVKTPPQNIEKANETILQTVNKTADIAKNTASVATSSSYDLENGKKVFKRCIPCHGAKANLNAVGKSQDISKWSEESIANSLKGYKDGTYGGAMKATMTSLLKTLNQQDITDVASYISTLGE
jgi:cytochrome c553